MSVRLAIDIGGTFTDATLIDEETGETHIVNVRHGGAVAGWDPAWVLEMPARVDRAGIHPIPASPLPPAVDRRVARPGPRPSRSRHSSWVRLNARACFPSPHP